MKREQLREEEEEEEEELSESQYCKSLAGMEGFNSKIVKHARETETVLERVNKRMERGLRGGGKGKGKRK